MSLRVRQALLSDSHAITEIYRSLVTHWYHTDADGSQTESSYSKLSLYERWQHGGPWLSVETCAVWLGHLLQHDDSIPLLAELDGEVIGQAEIFIGHEAPPYGQHINISTLCVRAGMGQIEVAAALVGYAEEMARVLGCRQMTVAYAEPADFFGKLGFEPHITREPIALQVEEGRVFYRALDLTDAHPTQIKGWHMPLGRFQNAREEWERMFWPMWNGVPPLVQSEWHRLVIELTGQPAILHLHQHDNDPQTVTARLWTKNPPTTQIFSAVRDRAARLGYTQIKTLVDAAVRPMFSDAQADGPPQQLYSKALGR